MNVTFTDDSWQEYLDWQATDKKIASFLNLSTKTICKVTRKY